MFTGIVQEVGTFVSRDQNRLVIQSKFHDLVLGESIAVNGVCLTIVPPSQAGELHFDLSEETWHRTSLRSLRTGAKVNLERAMTVSARFGGHIVQGHVDGQAKITRWVQNEGSITMTVQTAQHGNRYLIDKGSITLDGISLTVVEPRIVDECAEFDLWLIPHTIAHTNLQSKSVGDHLNVEFDVLAKHIEKLLLTAGRI